jgi:hypothetical protein
MPGGGDTAGRTFRGNRRKCQPNTPSTMAPTKANARYAVTTLSLLTVMGRSLFTSLPASTHKFSKPFAAEKVRPAVRALRNRFPPVICIMVKNA